MAAPYEKLFSCGSRRHCPMEVGTYVRIKQLGDFSKPGNWLRRNYVIC